MGSSPDSDSSSSKIFINPEQQSGFDASSDSDTDPAEDHSNASSEECTDSDEDFTPGMASGGCSVIDLAEAPPRIVEKVNEGIDAAIEEFNKRHGTTYKLVAIDEVTKTICSGFCFSLHFTAKPTESPDHLLTNFEACVAFDQPDYKLALVECEAKSSDRAATAAA